MFERKTMFILGCVLSMHLENLLCGWPRKIEQLFVYVHFGVCFPCFSRFSFFTHQLFILNQIFHWFFIFDCSLLQFFVVVPFLVFHCLYVFLHLPFVCHLLPYKSSALLIFSFPSIVIWICHCCFYLFLFFLFICSLSEIFFLIFIFCSSCCHSVELLSFTSSALLFFGLHPQQFCPFS